MVLHLLSGDDINQVSSVFNALGNPTRLRIVELISKTARPLHIKAIAKNIKKDYAAIYRHVKVLQKSGLVGIYEVGRSRVIYIKDDELFNNFVELTKKMVGL
jgi:DNA-binding transcriptional ArsR family regulator